jgi:hypothetical protein
MNRMDGGAKMAGREGATKIRQKWREQKWRETHIFGSLIFCSVRQQATRAAAINHRHHDETNYYAATTANLPTHQH